MRTVGIAAIFLLSLVSIVEGAFLFRLSRQVSALTQERPAMELDRGEEAAPSASRRSDSGGSRPARAAAPGSIGNVPNFQTLAPPSTTPATTTLREALATTEGRQQLKAAMDVISEERRQARLVEFLPRREERDQRWKERIMKTVPLTGDESAKLTTMFTDMQAGRRRILDDMKAGLKNAEQTDNEIDELHDNTERSIHALLGDERSRKLREARRGGGQQQEGQGQGQVVSSANAR
jgi:hypothetical protein